MKKVINAVYAAEIKETLMASAITGGPNNRHLGVALFKKEPVFIWLDDTIKQFISVSGLEVSSNDSGSRTKWIITGILEYAEVHFSFCLAYDAHNRQGILPDACGFTELTWLHVVS